MNKNYTKPTTFVLTLLAIVAFNIPIAKAQMSSDVKHAIHLRPIGLALGTFSIGYEYLFKSKHGLVIEPSLLRATRSNSTGYGLFIAYRNHTSSEMSSLFWSPFVSLHDFNSEVIVEDYNGLSYFPFKTQSALIGCDIGRKWVWNSGFAFTWRAGIGIPIYTFEWTEKLPEETVRRISETATVLSSALDVEVSIGYCF